VPPRARHEVAPLRVLTWNVGDLLGDPLAVHRVIRAARADVACLQEVYRWPLSRNRLAELARQCGMYFTCGGRASAGTALFTSLRVEVRSSQARRLPVEGLGTRPRGWAGAVLRLAGTEDVSVLCVHFGLSAHERADHVERLSALLSASAAPSVVAGDLNEGPSGASWAAMLQRLSDPGQGTEPTFPAYRPRRRIDAVLVDPALDVVSYGWPDGVDEADVLAASDHRPVLAQIALPAA
jgi:endonuclease/exonuclease/phosphatase family metal-dependent hydrolase